MKAAAIFVIAGCGDAGDQLEDGRARHIGPLAKPPASIQVLARMPVLVASGAGLWYGTGEDYALDHYEFSEDSLVVSARAERPDEAPPPPLVHAGTDGQASGGESSMQPYYLKALVDETGLLWVLDRAGRRWSVFEASGALVAEVEPRPGFVPFQIGRDFVLFFIWTRTTSNTCASTDCAVLRESAVFPGSSPHRVSFVVHRGKALPQPPSPHGLGAVPSARSEGG